ncbi:hypothetical protein E8E13_005237 [Curvularia kusanoi]|uniref:F-box domain-containing protein n=1 Tax=Curvularia kusanoi TaxID=90978 RepID=A0A9P4TGC0_CURKU|nr:hypothetical protein E8E13_005237 [Curvularia kusanoi]
MGFFHLHRNSSAASTRSTSTGFSQPSLHSTPRTSTDSSAEDYMSATLKPQQHATSHVPLLSLPFELLQLVASYLDDVSAAKFSLSNKQICYTLGTQRLSDYISSSGNRFTGRERLQETIERALPGAWHCAWCEKFHAWGRSEGPSHSPSQTPTQPCLEYNSFISSSPAYILRYHHIRLALAAHMYGAAHGIPLGNFSHSRSASITLFNTPVQTHTSNAAAIRHGHLLLHTSFSALLPTWAASNRNLLAHLWPLLPAALTQHRASENGHSGMMAAIDNVVRRGWRVLGAQSCGDCETDWSVSAFEVPRSVAGEFVRLTVQTWRDLGDGGSPFERRWRAHGAFVLGCDEMYAQGPGTGREKGGIKEVFEGCGGGCGDEVEGNEWEKLAYSWQLEKEKGEERRQEKEWRAIWNYVERRAEVEGGRSA